MGADQRAGLLAQTHSTYQPSYLKMLRSDLHLALTLVALTCALAGCERIFPRVETISVGAVTGSDFRARLLDSIPIHTRREDVERLAERFRFDCTAWSDSSFTASYFDQVKWCDYLERSGRRAKFQVFLHDSSGVLVRIEVVRVPQVREVGARQRGEPLPDSATGLPPPASMLRYADSLRRLFPDP